MKNFPLRAALRKFAQLFCIFAAAALPANADPTGGTLHFMLDNPVRTYDPARANDAASACAQMAVYEGLMRFERSSVRVQPNLAKDYKISDNGRIYTFYLRDGVRFSNGAPLRAKDVIYSLRRSPRVMQVVDEIFAIDENVLQITLQQPFAPFLHLLASPAAAIMSEEFARAGENADTQLLEHRAMGTGPFVLVNRNEQIEFVANEFYWRGSPHLGGLVISWGDFKSRLRALQSGHVQAIYAPEAMRTSKDYGLLATPGFNTLALAFNTRHQALFNERIRQAIAMGINRQQIADVTGASVVAEGILPPDAYGYDIAQKSPEFLPFAARHMLHEEGYLHGFELDLVYFTDGPLQGRFVQASAAKIAEQLRDMGIRVRVRGLSWAEYQRGARADLLLLNFASSYGDSDDFMHKILDFNPTGFGSKQLDKLIGVARISMSEREREQYYRAAQAIISASGAWLVLTHASEQIAQLHNVGGFVAHPLAGVCDFYELRFVK